MGDTLTKGYTGPIEWGYKFSNRLDFETKIGCFCSQKLCLESCGGGRILSQKSSEKVYGYRFRDEGWLFLQPDAVSSNLGRVENFESEAENDAEQRA